MFKHITNILKFNQIIVSNLLISNEDKNSLGAIIK